MFCYAARIVHAVFLDFRILERLEKEKGKLQAISTYV